MCGFELTASVRDVQSAKGTKTRSYSLDLSLEIRTVRSLLGPVGALSNDASSEIQAPTRQDTLMTLPCNVASGKMTRTGAILIEIQGVKVRACKTLGEMNLMLRHAKSDCFTATENSQRHKNTTSSPSNLTNSKPEADRQRSSAAVLAHAALQNERNRQVPIFNDAGIPAEFCVRFECQRRT